MAVLLGNLAVLVLDDVLRLVGSRRVPAGSYRFILGAVVSTESTTSARIIQRRLPVPREYYDQKGVDTGRPTPSRSGIEY